MRNKRIPRLILLGGVAVVLVVLLILTTTGIVKIPFLDTVVRVTVVPVQQFFTNVITNTQRYFDEMAFQRELESAYNQVLEDNKQLQVRVGENEELRRENERLLKLLGRAEETAEEEFLLGRVVAMNPSSWFSSFTIDIGSNQGAQLNDPVLNSDGLIGRITEIHGGYAVVTTIIDGRSAVSAMIERTRDSGIIRGNLYLTEQDELCRMSYLREGAQVIIGDRVITSGLDGVYPKGLYIGTVRDINRDASSDHYVVVNPAVNFQSIEEVLVLRVDRQEWQEEEP